MKFRALLAMGLALLVTPLQAALTYTGQLIPIEFARLLVSEVLIGLLLGAGITILFSGVQLAGQIVSQFAGLSLSQVYDPNLKSHASPITQLFYYTTLAVFVGFGGHRLVMQAMLDSFTWAPPGQAVLGDSFLEAVTTLLNQSFSLGIRAAAPVMAALLLSTLLMGFISRSLPQLNTLAVGLSVNSLLMLGILFISIGSIAWLFQDSLTTTLETLSSAITHSYSG
jgi:flagellar biosynthetic protein FliR